MEARRRGEPITNVEEFERDLHEVFRQAECEILQSELSRLDVDLPAIVIDGVEHRRVLRCPENYQATSGTVRIERSLYSTRQGERAVCPLELRSGIVEGRWTPLAAQQAIWAVAHLTPQEGEDLFARLGGMRPSKSSLDRLPKQMSARWEQERERFEATLRATQPVPTNAVAVAVSLDGVMVPMKDGQREAKRAATAAAGKETRGPAGYQEVGCATLSYYDAEGERISTVRMARMPEPKKATLKASLAADLQAALAQRPDLQVVKVADGAKDNWTYLDELPSGHAITDFYHVAEHLNSALQAAYGENSSKAKVQFEKLRHVLRHESDGAAKTIRAMVHLRNGHPKSRTIAREIQYFRDNQHRMDYADTAAANLPIGSGVTEATCKTLATQRLKRSGMHWRHAGGQAILTFRGWAQSERFDAGWAILASTYKRHVAAPSNVVPFAQRRASA